MKTKLIDIEDYIPESKICRLVLLATSYDNVKED